MRRMLLMLLLLPMLWPGVERNAAGQESFGGIFYSKFREFRIPFQPGLAQQGVKQLQLYVSTDSGKSWQPAVIAPPDQANFRFQSDRDGLFWFTVQTQDVQGRVNPVSLEGAQPSLKVIVDTQLPVVTLQAMQPRGGEVGVGWDIRDDNLDLSLPDAIRLEYRLPGTNDWRYLPRSPVTNQQYWRPETTLPFEVRLRARDRAGNWGEATTTIGIGGSGSLPQNPAPSNSSAFATGEPDRRYVNTKNIILAYEVADVGPSGAPHLDLWFTMDGRSWNKYPRELTKDVEKKRISFPMDSEGVYGLTLVAKSGVGLGERPPQIGDRPQVWVEVDLSKPVVQLYNVIVGQGLDKGKLTMTWAARDKNLHELPITISYRAPDKDWTPIVKNHGNTGRFVWIMTEEVPYQFHVKVEAVDLAGNVGESVTADMVKVDLSQPKAKILNVEPASR